MHTSTGPGKYAAPEATIEYRLAPTGQAIKAFMITTNPDIAKSDCLFYAVKATGEPIF